MKKIYYVYVFSILSILLTVTSNAFGQGQCKINNTFFQGGEVIEYDLHVKWGILSSKGGTARIATTNTTYKGQSAYKMSLTSSSQGAARKLFALDDTLTCYMTKDLVPLAFHKDAHEGGDYTKERVTYSYPGGNQVKINLNRYKNGNFKFDENVTANNCTYDMMSVVFYARTLDYANMKKGTKTSVDFVSGRTKKNMQIIHDGAETIKGNDGLKYNCIKLSLVIYDDAFENKEDAMKVYITNDDNRLPVRIDSKLKVGSTRVMLKSYKGNLHPVNSSK